MKNNRTILAIFASLLLIVAVGVYSLFSSDTNVIKTTSNIDYSNGAKRSYVRQSKDYSNQMQSFVTPMVSTTPTSSIKVEANRVANSPLTSAQSTSYNVLGTTSSSNQQNKLVSISGSSNSSTGRASSVSSSSSSSFSTTTSVGTISLSESFAKMTAANETLTRGFGDYNNDPGEVVPIGSVLPLLLLGAIYMLIKWFL